MKDEELKLEEIEASHTVGGQRRCRCYSTVRYTTVVNRSRLGRGCEREFLDVERNTMHFKHKSPFSFRLEKTFFSI
jgi:hypothetical protein